MAFGIDNIIIDSGLTGATAVFTSSMSATTISGTSIIASTITQNGVSYDLSGKADLSGSTFTGNVKAPSMSATTISSTTLTVSGVTFNKLLIEKVGSVSSSSFSGNPKTFAVTFASNFADTNYAIFINGTDDRTYTWESQATSGFTINANANKALTGNVFWMAKQIGEV